MDRRERPAAAVVAAEEYEDLGVIAVGGMGEVRRVRDLALDRTVAMKVVRADLAGRGAVLERFAAEARVAAQLQHPGMPPVHEYGTLPDGRRYFTMREVRGKTLTDEIDAAHALTDPGVALHRLVDVFARACEAMAYAHARGVVHRDLKPDNVLCGAFGEVLVIDWGIAKLVGGGELALDGGLEDGEGTLVGLASRTQLGQVLGTAAYMAPEQARGEIDRMDARTDVYALGAVLFEILVGGPPYAGKTAREVVRQVVAGPPVPLRERAARRLPDDLVALCEHAMARDPADRPPDALALARAARAWLEGARQRERALHRIAEADALADEIALLRATAADLDERARAALRGIPGSAPEVVKHAGWALADEAEAARRRAHVLDTRVGEGLEAALTLAPNLPLAHERLLARALAAHREAEAVGDAISAERAAERTTRHLQALPEDAPARIAALAWLDGTGALDLDTDPSGAAVQLYRFETRHRRAVPVPHGPPLRTPIRRHALPMGSYLARIHGRGCDEARVPFVIDRGRHERFDRPGTGPARVRLPRTGELGPDDVLVPPGWGLLGRKGGWQSLPQRRLWLDAVVVRRYPVTNREYLGWLNTLVAEGRAGEAEERLPRERSGQAGGRGAALYVRGPDGRYALGVDAQGHAWDLDWPVLMVDWFDAVAYCRDQAARTGQPWRLLGELERERACAGVDGRSHAWGDGPDGSRACTSDSQGSDPAPAVVSAFPTDESVYGVRHTSGNARDWCVDAHAPEGPPVLDGGRIARPTAPTDAELHGPKVKRAIRGQNWSAPFLLLGAAVRFALDPDDRMAAISFRMGRDAP